MKRIVILMTVAACLLFGVEMVFAQSNNTDRGENVEPNAKPGRVESQDSNDSAGKTQEQERERLREGARDRIREIAQQRRQGRIGEGQQPVDSNQQTSMQFGIRSIPTLLIFKNGKVVDQIVGAVPKAALADKVSKHLN